MGRNCAWGRSTGEDRGRGALGACTLFYLLQQWVCAWGKLHMGGASRHGIQGELCVGETSVSCLTWPAHICAYTSHVYLSGLPTLHVCPNLNRRVRLQVGTTTTVLLPVLAIATTSYSDCTMPTVCVLIQIDALFCLQACHTTAATFLPAPWLHNSTCKQHPSFKPCSTLPTVAVGWERGQGGEQIGTRPMLGAAWLHQAEYRSQNMRH